MFSLVLSKVPANQCFASNKVAIERVECWSAVVSVNIPLCKDSLRKYRQ